jgi:xylulokinase
MEDLLLGIDIGTGSCKCCLMDASGDVLGRAATEYQPAHPRTGWVEQDPAEWYIAFLKCLKQLEAQTGLSPRQVGAVGVTGQMRGATFLDQTGEPVRPSILWNDLRCTSEVSELLAGSGRDLKRITHNPLNTMCTLPKLLWIQRHEPDSWEKTTKVLYPKDYIIFKLTPECVTDHSDASGSSFYDLEQQEWSDEILGEWKIPQSKLPVIHSSTDVIGRVTGRAAQETGLRANIPVCAGGSDATVEMLALGIDGQHQCKIRLGTSGALSTIVGSLSGHEDAEYYIWSYLQPGNWMIDINTRACADATVWLKDVFYREAATSDDAYGLIGREALSVPLGADGLFFHPYLLGEDAPYWQPDLRGSFFGLTKSHGRPECARAVLEGTGFALRDARSMLGEMVEGFEKYTFVGGGTRNATWLRIVADILGVDGTAAVTADASLGAAMLAGVAAGVFQGLHQAIATCSRAGEVIRHDAGNHATYDRLFAKYKQIKQILDAAY